jgi:hypothetical protein
MPISRLLSRKSKDKHEAQYSFSDQSRDFILNRLLRNNLNRVICIGTPVIHEAIQSESDAGGRDSILLDIDHRIAQFYPKSKFVWFNMFNHFFFDGKKGVRRLNKFISSSAGEQIVLVVDPPFGALMELLADTLNFLIRKIRFYHDVDDIPVILCLPFFLSAFVSKTMPNMKMSEYCVQYADHSRYKKNSSPVRIFTNMPLDEFNVS